MWNAWTKWEFKLIDYQLHSRFSDGRADIGQIIRAAELKGLSEIAITDHLILGGHSSHTLTAEKLPTYFRTVDEARRKARIRVRVGLEVDYFPDRVDELVEALEVVPLDFVLFSTHYPNGLGLEDPANYVGKSHEQAAEAYFSYWSRGVQAAVRRGLGDSVDHADYFRRWSIPFYGGDLLFEKQRSFVEGALGALSKSGLCIDVSTSGFREGLSTTFPSRDFVSYCVELGIDRFTISSDSHDTEHIGFRLGEAVRLLRSLGIRHVYTFENRKPKKVALESL